MDWSIVTDALLKVVILSFLIERALAIVFDMEAVEPILKERDLKPVIAVVISVAACYLLKVDAVGPLAKGYSAESSELRWLGYGLTGLVVAGGSAGAVKLFQDVLGFRRAARDQVKEVVEIEAKAAKAEAEARLEAAAALTSTARVEQLAASARIMTGTGNVGGSTERQILASRIAMRRLKLLRGS